MTNTKEQIKANLTSATGKQFQALVDRACRKYGIGSEQVVRAVSAFDAFVYGSAA